MFRDGLPKDLVRALFCGLPNRDKRMAVFVCVADESADQNPLRDFFYGGYSAPLDDWDGCFAEAWSERVLNKSPKLKWVHMSEIYNRAWCEKHGFTWLQLMNRLDDAADVLRSTGSLIPVLFDLNQVEYDALVKQPFQLTPKQVITLDPDYMCFQFFAYTQLDLIKARYGSEVEKVDFWVERNGKITRHMQVFHQQLADGLSFIGRDDLVPLVGGLQPVDKDRVPAQAADMLAWHSRNLKRGRLDEWSQQRYSKMITGDVPSGRNRYGRRHTISTDSLRALAEGLAKSQGDGSSSVSDASSQGTST